jgi:hypothetical protein
MVFFICIRAREVTMVTLRCGDTPLHGMAWHGASARFGGLVSRLSRAVDLIGRRRQQNRPLKVVKVRCGYAKDPDVALDRHGRWQRRHGRISATGPTRGSRRGGEEGRRRGRDDNGRY